MNYQLNDEGKRFFKKYGRKEEYQAELKMDEYQAILQMQPFRMLRTKAVYPIIELPEKKMKASKGSVASR